MTGSTCDIPASPSWIERYWFRSARPSGVVNYINSGHLIVARSLFERIGGFDERLETGEDYDFCRRAH